MLSCVKSPVDRPALAAVGRSSVRPSIPQLSSMNGLCRSKGKSVSIYLPSTSSLWWGGEAFLPDGGWMPRGDLCVFHVQQWLWGLGVD